MIQPTPSNGVPDLVRHDREWEFAKVCAEGDRRTLGEIYRAMWPEDEEAAANPRIAHERGVKLYNKPEVAQHRETLKADIKRRCSVSMESYLHELDTLQAQAVAVEQFGPAAKMLELKGRASGLYAPVQTQNKRLTVAEAKEQLKLLQARNPNVAKELLDALRPVQVEQLAGGRL